MRKHSTPTPGTRRLFRPRPYLTAAGLVLLLSITAVAAPRVVPILPAPRHARQLPASFRFHLSGQANWTGLDKAALGRLEVHWRNFTTGLSGDAPATESPEPGGTPKEGTVPEGSNVHGQVIQFGIMGKDPAFDRKVTAAVQALTTSGPAGPSQAWTDSLGKEGYILSLHENKVLIAATTETGLFYGLQSLRQLVHAGWDHELVIADWPSFPIRAIFDDISRGPISTIDYIKHQIARMAEIKINGLSFYIEHVVQPLSHPDFAPADGKLTIADIKALSAYADSFHIQLIGSFQSFGHFEKILSLPQYASMGATNTLIDPDDPKARTFLADVIGELCDAFSAPWFNVNCDETFDLGQGRTKAPVDSIGAAAFYAGHLQFLDSVVRSHGKKMMMWGDFFLQHPETFAKMPADITYLTWEYGDQPSYDQWIKPFAERSLPFLVCPGILNTYRLFPDLAMARGNIDGFAQQGLREGAKGVLTTIWDDGSAYLFSADWYGVYTTAEAGWSARTGSSFDQRYESTAYGPMDGSYVRSMQTLMALRQVPLTYNLGEAPWLAKLLPDSNKQLIMNNSSVQKALEIIRLAQSRLGRRLPSRNAADIRTLSFTLSQYALMLNSRLRIASVADDYREALHAGPQQASRLLAHGVAVIDTLQKAYVRLRDTFRKAWLAEDQPYWLDKAQQPYDEKIASLSRLAQGLRDARYKALARQPLPSPAPIGLDIRVSPYEYFQGWMLSGPFPTREGSSFPPFLYAEDTAYDHPPTPGNFTRWLNKMYRWKKYASNTGGIVDPENIFDHTRGDVIYAYCLIKSDTNASIRAYLAAGGEDEVYCNGSIVNARAATGVSAGHERELTLPLHAGVNHILIKLRKDRAQAWTFTFRLQDNIRFTNHKFKYQLNGKNKLYAAD